MPGRGRLLDACHRRPFQDTADQRSAFGQPAEGSVTGRHLGQQHRAVWPGAMLMLCCEIRKPSVRRLRPDLHRFEIERYVERCTEMRSRLVRIQAGEGTAEDGSGPGVKVR